MTKTQEKCSRGHLREGMAAALGLNELLKGKNEE